MPGRFQHHPDVAEDPPRLGLHIAPHRLIGIGIAARRPGDEEDVACPDPPRIRERRRLQPGRRDHLGPVRRGHRRDLHQRIPVGEVRLHRGPRGRVAGEVPPVDPVHGLEVAGVPEEDVHHDDVPVVEPPRAELLAQRVQHTGRLLLDGRQGTAPVRRGCDVREVDEFGRLGGRRHRRGRDGEEGCSGESVKGTEDVVVHGRWGSGKRVRGRVALKLAWPGCVLTSAHAYAEAVTPPSPGPTSPAQACRR